MPRPRPADGIRLIRAISIRPTLWRWVEEQSAKEGMNRSQFVTQALVAYRQLLEAEPW